RARRRLARRARGVSNRGAVRRCDRRERARAHGSRRRRLRSPAPRGGSSGDPRSRAGGRGARRPARRAPQERARRARGPTGGGGAVVGGEGEGLKRGPAEVEADRAAEDAAYGAVWQASGLAPLLPGEMRAWAERRAHLLELAAESDRVASELERLESRRALVE